MKTVISFKKILFAFFAFIALLLFVRMYFSGRIQYLFLVWNIFLAWIPFVISTLFDKVISKSKWKQVAIFCCWLAFFPNALYIITDLVHLQLQSSVPKWFDALLLFSAAVVGLLMAFISLYRVEKYLQKIVSQRLLAPIIMLIIFLGSFGVYLGRFLRWNSWDIISNPFQLLISVVQRIIFPLDHLYTWGVTFIFAAFFYLLYISVKNMPGYLNRAYTQ